MTDDLMTRPQGLGRPPHLPLSPQGEKKGTSPANINPLALKEQKKHTPRVSAAPVGRTKKHTRYTQGDAPGSKTGWAFSPHLPNTASTHPINLGGIGSDAENATHHPPSDAGKGKLISPPPQGEKKRAHPRPWSKGETNAETTPPTGRKREGKHEKRSLGHRSLGH